MTLKELDKAHVWHPFTQEKIAAENIVIESAKDAVLVTDKGEEIIDCNSSWWVSIHGHCNERLANAVHKQLLHLDHVIFAGFSIFFPCVISAK